ncbi:hypothetical protein D3C76_803110 [compost metagenome]
MVIAQQFAPAIAQADVQTRVVDGIEGAVEARRCGEHLGQQFGDHRLLQAVVAQHGAGGDAGAETDDQRRMRLAVMDQQRQQCLQAHVAQRWHGVAGVRHTLYIEATELPAALALFHHRHGAAPTFLVEGDLPVARTGEQLRQMARLGVHADREGGQADQRDAPARPFANLCAPPDRQQADQRRHAGQHRQGTHQAEAGNQDETGQHDADDATQGVQRHHSADIAADMVAVHRQAQGQRERGAQQRGRQEHHAGCRHREARAHAGQLVAGHLQGQQFRAGLQDHQPVAEPGDLQQCQQARQGDQHAEQAPGIAQPVRTPRIQGAAQHQAGQVGRQHHGEGEAPGAHELHDGLRPHHLVAQRHATGQAVEGNGQARLGGTGGRGRLCMRSCIPTLLTHQ